MSNTLKKMFILACVLVCNLPLHEALAGKGGHGGHGLLISGKPYVIDLVEYGVEEKPFVNSLQQIYPFIRERVIPKMIRLNVDTELLSQKLSEIYSKDRILGWSLLKALELFTWQKVNQELVPIQLDDSLLDYKKEDLIQLAIRREQTIRINGDLWGRLDRLNQVALIVHEIVFALVKPVEVNGQLFQLSAHARDITGLFFTPQFSWMTKSGLRQFGVHERLPMESSSFALLHEDKALAQVSYDGRLYLHGYIRNKRGGFGWHDLIIGVNDDMDSLKKKVEKYCSLSTFEKENNWKIDRNVSLHYVESGTALKHSRLSSNDTYLEFWNWESGNPRSRAISRRPLAEMRIENMKHCQETLIYGMRDYLNYRY